MSLRTHADGRVSGTFNVDPVTGEIIKQHLGNEESALFNEDNECGFPRKAPQRRAQAFTNLVKRGAGRTETSAKPVIHVVMSLKVLMHAIEQLAKDEADQDFLSVLDPNSVDGRCELQTRRNRRSLRSLTEFLAQGLRTRKGPPSAPFETS